MIVFYVILGVMFFTLALVTIYLYSSRNRRGLEPGRKLRFHCLTSTDQMEKEYMNQGNASYPFCALPEHRESQSIYFAIFQSERMLICSGVLDYEDEIEETLF